MFVVTFVFCIVIVRIFIFVCLHIRYKGPDRKKLLGPILEKMYNTFRSEQFRFFKGKTGFGRAITGDGATILGTKFINFLCHEHGRGAMLCHLKDCSERLLEVGTVEATFIAHELIKAIRLILCNNISNININILTLTLLIPGWLDLPALRVSSPMAALTGRLARTWCKINSRGSFSCIACRTRRHYVSSTFFKSPR